MTIESVKAFRDYSCPKCGGSYGWCGTIYDAPPCPDCGHTIPVADLEHDERLINEARANARSEEAEDTHD